VLGETIELFWSHQSGLGDVDHVFTRSGDFIDVSGLSAKRQTDAQLFNLHLLAIESDGQWFSLYRDGHCFHGLASGQATR
jgi:hypothetical protein